MPRPHGAHLAQLGDAVAVIVRPHPGFRVQHQLHGLVAARAQVQRRLLHGAVDVAHGRHQVEQDEGEVVDALDEGHAHQPVHDGDGEAEVFVEQQVDRAVAPEDQLQGHRAHEGRHDQRQHAQRLDQQRAAELEAHREVGQRDGDQRGKKHAGQRHDEAVEEGLAEHRGAEEGAEVAQRQRTGFVDEGGVDHGADGHQNKHQQEVML